MRFQAWTERRLPQPLLVGGLVSAVVGGSVLMGLRLGNGLNVQAILPLGALLGILGLLFVTKYAQTLVLALPLTALFLPTLQLPTGTESPLPLSLLLTCVLSGLWLAAVSVRGGALSPSPLNLPILIFGAICVLSLGWGIVWRDPVLINAPKFIMTQSGALITILMSLAAPLIIGNFVTSERQLRFILGAFIVGGSLMTLTQLLGITQTVLNDRGLWSLWTATPLLGLLIVQPGIRWFWRLGLGGVLLLHLYLVMVVNADWLSGWFPSVTALAALVFIRSPKLFFSLLPFAGLLLVISMGFFETVAQDNINDGSLERLIIWQQNWRVVQDHWLVGTGPAGYAIYYMSYFPQEARSTHNNYLDVVAQFGFVGLGCWFWLAVTALQEGWRLSRQLPSGFRRTLAMTVTAGWLGGCVAMFFGDWLLPFAYNQGIAGYKYTVYTWIFLGMLIVLRRLADQDGQLQPMTNG